MTKRKIGRPYGEKEGPIFGHWVDSVIKGKKRKAVA